MNKRCFLHFIFLLLIIKVSVSVPPIVEGFKGDTVILPCLIEQNPDSVFWRFGDSNTVCVIIKGEAHFEEQASVFRNRVGIFSSEITLGNFSIMLNSVSKTDEGLYTCYAPNEVVRREIKLKVKEKPGSGQNKSQVDGVMFLLECVLLYNFSF